jgi:GH25 family lysozyme M1 (1,4-beta-N-acetylmuramidase)
MLSWLKSLFARLAARRLLSGVDVASYQGPPGQWAGAAGNISWAAVKITELEPGGVRYVNPDARADWDYLASNGKLRIGYLFCHPSVSAADTVDFFVTELRGLGLKPGDGVAIDLEVTDGLGPEAVSSWAADVTARLRRALDRHPVVYTYLSFAEAGNCAGLGGYPLWISNPSRPAGRPQVPAPWRTWAIHQYSITGSIDRDVANYSSRAAMAAALGVPPAAPRLLEDSMLVNSGANADTPVALPNGAKSVRLAAISPTTVHVQFTGSQVQKLGLSWDHAETLQVPAGAQALRVFRPADGNPDVLVSLAVS